MTPFIVPYLDYEPQIGEGAQFGEGAAVIGRAVLGRDVAAGDFAALRADGERIEVGDGCRLLARATVHISDGRLPSRIGARATVGRYALVHACDIGADCVLADGAVVMDGSALGPRAAVAAGALVPPGKTLEGGALYAGAPARAVRALDTGALAAFRGAVLAGRGGEHLDFPPPPLNMAPWRGAGAGPLYEHAGAAPHADPAAYVAPNAVVCGRVLIAESASVWFATVIAADGAEIRVGPRTSVQDNSLLATHAKSGRLEIGADVTIGHNVRMGACRVGDRCLIGMGAEVADGTVVEDDGVVAARALTEPGTRVRAGWIWAGRPARAFRPVTDAERRFFRRGAEIYVAYAARYLAGASGRSGG